MKNARSGTAILSCLLASAAVVGCARDADAPADRADAADAPAPTAGAGGTGGTAGRGAEDAGRGGTGGGLANTGGVSGAGGQFGRGNAATPGDAGATPVCRGSFATGRIIDGQCVDTVAFDPTRDNRSCPTTYAPEAFRSWCDTAVTRHAPRRYGPCNDLYLVQFMIGSSIIWDTIRCHYDLAGRLVGTDYCSDQMSWCGTDCSRMFTCFVRGKAVRECTSGEQPLCPTDGGATPTDTQNVSGGG